MPGEGRRGRSGRRNPNQSTEKPDAPVRVKCADDFGSSETPSSVRYQAMKLSSDCTWHDWRLYRFEVRSSLGRLLKY